MGFLRDTNENYYQQDLDYPYPFSYSHVATEDTEGLDLELESLKNCDLENQASLAVDAEGRVRATKIALPLGGMGNRNDKNIRISKRYSMTIMRLLLLAVLVPILLLLLLKK